MSLIAHLNLPKGETERLTLLFSFHLYLILRIINPVDIDRVLQISGDKGKWEKAPPPRPPPKGEGNLPYPFRRRGTGMRADSTHAREPLAHDRTINTHTCMRNIRMQAWATLFHMAIVPYVINIFE